MMLAEMDRERPLYPQSAKQCNSQQRALQLPKVDVLGI
jgi:hypothetical protein